MTINVIFDDRHHQDYERLIEEFAIQGIREYKFWPAIVDKNCVVSSINASHKMIVRDAMENGFREVIIAEQDLMFSAPDSWKVFMEKKPEDFDCYLGATYLVNKPHEWEPPLLKVNEWVGSHLIIIHEKYYERFLAVPDYDHIDTIQRGLGDFYVCYPFVALQRSGYSSNCAAVVNYNSNLNKEFIHR